MAPSSCDKRLMRKLLFSSRTPLLSCDSKAVPLRSSRSLPRRQFSTTQRSRISPQSSHTPKEFASIVDAPPHIVSTNKKHTPLGIACLALIPLTAFALGSWQVQRLDWKSKLIARFEDRLVRDPLPLPPRIDPDAIHEFDYRRVYARGVFRHDKEMLVGPRMRDGKDGFFVITPLERRGSLDPEGTEKDIGGSTILINRGWISREKRFQQDRRDPACLPIGEVVVSGLLREPWKRNMFTPANEPARGRFYFPDVKQMAELTGADAVWIEETMTPDLLIAYDREDKGIPIGRAPEVNLRNNHTQYIFTW